MSNITKYVDEFFDILQIYEDTITQQDYKNRIHKSMIDFIKISSIENAFKVYEEFFNAYWIGTGGDQNPFIELIQKMKSFEEYAGLLLPRQRDHYIHSVYVFIVGVSIFARSNKFQENFNSVVLDKSIYKDSYDTKNEEFFYRWGIASLFHDIAYPLQITIQQINVYIDFISYHSDVTKKNLRVKMSIDNIDDFNHLPQILPLPEFSNEFRCKYPNCEALNLSDSIDLLAHKLNICFGTEMLQLKKGLIKFTFKMQNEHFIDHGYYSALIVLRWYYYLIQKAKWNPAYFYYPIVDSASAILLHNYYRHGLMISPYNLGRLGVEKHPIAYLLILCDELQDWKRVAYGEIDKESSMPVDFSILVTDDVLELVYVTDGSDLPHDYIKKKSIAITEVLDTDYLFPKGVTINERVYKNGKEKSVYQF